MLDLQIGQKIKYTEDYTIEAALSGKKFKVKKGDIGAVVRKVSEGKAEVKLLTGEARGKLLLTEGNVDGYDTKAIAKQVAHELAKNYLEADDIEVEEEIVPFIENILDEYLEG